MYLTEHYMNLNFALYLATFVAGISIAYVITEWLLSNYKKKSKSDVNSNENHYPNGNVKRELINSSADCLGENNIIKCENVKNDENESQVIDDQSNDKNKDCFDIKYQQIVKSQGFNSDLAAIILTDNNNVEWYETVCITSGSNVISPENLEPQYVLVDCRAATLARRCFIRFLYKKLNEVIKQNTDEENCLFASIPGSNRFELKNNFRVNLYLNQPPDNYDVSDSVGEHKKLTHQLIRLKSTTDKIGLWNQVGLQGSLLSHFLNSIHINSVIIALNFNEKSIRQHFVLNYAEEPKLLQCENIKKEINEKSAKLLFNGYNKLASNWVQTEGNVEFIDCDSGKAISDVNHELYVSRLSKHELNKCFRDFLTKYQHNLRPHQSLPMTYRKWKESAPNYRIQKQLLKVRYAVAGRQWNCVPSDLDMFT